MIQNSAPVSRNKKLCTQCAGIVRELLKEHNEDEDDENDDDNSDDDNSSVHQNNTLSPQVQSSTESHKYTYKLRFEASADVFAFIQLFSAHMRIVLNEDSFGCEFTFSSNKSLQEVRAVLSQVEDGHVMVDTVNYASKYTGERYYDP
jgi:hypothetical protein